MRMWPSTLTFTEQTWDYSRAWMPLPVLGAHMNCPKSSMTDTSIVAEGDLTPKLVSLASRVQA